MSAPKRIWATVNGASTRLPDGGRQLIGGWSEDKDRPRAVEYIRADLSAIEAPAAEGEAVAGKGEQRTICDACGNSNLAHDRAVWTDDGSSFCPGCAPSPAAASEVTETARDWSSNAERQAVEAGQLAAFEYSKSGGGPIGVFTEGIRAYRAALTAALKGDR